MRRAAGALLATLALFVAVAAPGATAPARHAAAPAKINGSGSTYVALAMQQWVADAQTSGLQVNYLPTGSPQGLTTYADGLADFAGTEAEYSAIGLGQGPSRGHQYVPDVAGAVAIMYNVADQAGRKVDYLRLSRSTVAKIFMGYISRWSDPQITADNKGLVLPDEPITVVYRGGLSGTTALFYDFVANTEPSLFQQWASRYRLPTQVRITQLDTVPGGFAPKVLALNGSDQIAQYVAGSQGKWAIAYDEFGYAVTYGAEAARIQNQSGDYVLPFAQNITAALESAKLRPDLSQDLRDVYTSSNPLAYPISAYSYLVTQCAPDAQRDTCKGPYSNSGVTETLALWMRYIACDGQVSMAEIGYSPLPPNLSQEIVNSIARMQGQSSPEQLTASNCANPRFQGNLGSGAESPPDPLDDVPEGALSGSDGGAALGGGGGSGGGAGGTDGDGGAAGGTDGLGSAVDGVAAAGLEGAAVAVGGGSATWREASPVEFASDTREGGSVLPMVLLLAVIGLPPAALAVASRRRA